MVESSFLELQNILDDRKQDLLTEADEIFQDKLQQLSLQESRAETSDNNINSIMKHIKHYKASGTNNEIVSLHKPVDQLMDKAIDQHKCMWSKAVEEIEDADIGVEVKCIEGLHNLCQTNIKLLYHIDPSMSEITINLEEPLKVNEVFTVTLTTKLGNGVQGEGVPIDSHYVHFVKKSSSMVRSPKQVPTPSV